MSWIQTFSGRRFDLETAALDSICIEDIAAALSKQCRFTGHTRAFYSVAQHSVLVSQHVPAEFRLEALLHDAAEAYLGDVSSPLKRLESMQGYRDREQVVLRQIYRRFGVTVPATLAAGGIGSAAVHEEDVRALATEKRDLMTPSPYAWAPLPKPWPELIHPWAPEFAEQAFLVAFGELFCDVCGPGHCCSGAAHWARFESGDVWRYA